MPRPPANWVASAGVIALSILVLVWRLRGIDPPALYLDDQWVSIVVHKMSWPEFFRLAPPVPPGFIALERVFSSIASDPEWPLQLLPMLASIALIPAIFIVGRLLTASAAVGLLAAALVATDPILAIYAVAAKQYATDALLVLVLLAIGLPQLEQGSTRGAWKLTLAALVAMPISFASIFVSAPLAHLSLFAAGKGGREKTRIARSALPPLLVLDAGLAISYLSFLRRQARPSMTDYWSGYFPSSFAPAEIWSFFASRGAEFVALALPDPLRWSALLCIPAILFLLARERTRLSGIFFVLFYLQMAVLAALALFPIGTGRIDIYAHGPTLLLVAVGAYALVTWIGVREREAAIVLGLLALLLVLLFGQRSAYRTSGDDVAVIRALERKLQPADGLVVYPLSTFALGAYGRWPVRLDEWPAQASGFEVVVERERTLSLHVYPEYTTEPWRMRDDLRAFLAQGHERVVLLTATEAKRAVQVFLHEEMIAAGYRVARESSEPPHVLGYERASQSAASQ